MPESSESSNQRESLDLGSFLWASLSTRRGENEREYTEPKTESDKALTKAFDGIEAFAHDLLTQATIPASLQQELADFMPGDSVGVKLRELLTYSLVQERIQFDIADSVVTRLDDLPQRLQVAVVAFTLLQRASLSATAIKYLERASTLFLAGYEGEVSVMCGAVLEAAMSARFPDDLLTNNGFKPAYKRTGVFSLGQRMQYEEKHPIFTDHQRSTFWELVSARNNAVHVHPELGIDPSHAVLFTAWLLPTILPASST